MPRSPSNVALVPLVQTKVPLLIASFVFASAFAARKVLHLALCLPKSIPATENWAHRFIKLFRRYPWTTFTWYPSHGALPVGLEPTTPRLTAVCSTDWAIRAKYSLLTRRDSNHLLLYPTLAALPDISYTPAMNIHRASWIRTNELRNQNPLPYRLAMALQIISFTIWSIWWESNSHLLVGSQLYWPLYYICMYFNVLMVLTVKTVSTLFRIRTEGRPVMSRLLSPLS